MFRIKSLPRGVPLRQTGVHSYNLLVWYAARRLRGAFCGQFVYWCFCFRLKSLDPNEHTSYLLIIYLWCIFACSIISISFDMSHDIGIEISRKYSRRWYRCIPTISHDIVKVLDTIPNTTSKQFRMHTWGHASLPPSWLCTAYTAAVVPRVVGFFSTHRIPSRLNKLRVVLSRATI